MVTIYNTTLSATSQRHFSDGLGGGFWGRIPKKNSHTSKCVGYSLHYHPFSYQRYIIPYQIQNPVMIG